MQNQQINNKEKEGNNQTLFKLLIVILSISLFIFFIFITYEILTSPMNKLSSLNQTYTNSTLDSIIHCQSVNVTVEINQTNQTAHLISRECYEYEVRDFYARKYIAEHPELINGTKNG